MGVRRCSLPCGGMRASRPTLLFLLPTMSAERRGRRSLQSVDFSADAAEWAGPFPTNIFYIAGITINVEKLTNNSQFSIFNYQLVYMDSSVRFMRSF